MTDKYILNDAGEPEACDDLLTWGRWLEVNRDKRHVAVDELPDGVRVSTVFLGLDHSFRDVALLNEPPILWETMIFGGPEDQYQERYTSKADALAGHARAVALARQSVVPK